MYDPRGIVKPFKLQAHPEACIGTPESIESKGRELARRQKSHSSGLRIRLTPENVPPGTPPGWRAFRFTNPTRVTLGTVCGVVYDDETGNSAFVVNDTPLPKSVMLSGPVFFTTKQDGPVPQESHILIPPNGYVSPELIESADEAGDDSSQ
jgi:hypothetical protein